MSDQAHTPTLDPRRRRTIDALLAAAEQAFASRPFDDVTVEEVGERAGVAVGSIYNNFGSKAGLYAAVVDRALDVDREYMDRAYTPGRSPIEQLEAAAEQFLRFYIDHPQYFRMLAFPGPAGNYPAAEETSARLARRVDEQNARMIDALERGIAAGSIRPLDTRRTATFLWSSMCGVISLAWRPDELRLDTQQLTETLSLGAGILGLGLRAG